MSESQREDGYQITKALLAKSIAIEKECTVDEVVIEEFSTSGGSNKGENFTCVLVAVDIKASVKGQSETFNYMIKCLPSSELRAKRLTEMKFFSRECFVYDDLAKEYQDLRSQKGMNKLALPKVYLTNVEEGIIVMENLKTQGYSMLNRLGGEEMSMDTARQVLEEAASFHATGYHYLQTFNNGGQKGFLTEHPEYDYIGWIAHDSAEAKAQFKGMLVKMLHGVTDVVEQYGDDAVKSLGKKMLDFLPNIEHILDDKTSSKKNSFNTLTHNDLHMNNVMYKKLENGEVDNVVLLDFQLMKLTRVTVDLAYFFGTSSTAKFRARFLDDLLKIYHTKLIQDLEIFGYKNSVYPLEQFVADFEDTWVFGFIMGCFHMQIMSMDFDGPNAFDPDKMVDDQAKQMKMMEAMKKAQLKRAEGNKPYLEKVFDFVQEASNKNII